MHSANDGGLDDKIGTKNHEISDSSIGSFQSESRYDRTFESADFSEGFSDLAQSSCHNQSNNGFDDYGLGDVTATGVKRLSGEIDDEDTIQIDQIEFQVNYVTKVS